MAVSPGEVCSSPWAELPHPRVDELGAHIGVTIFNCFPSEKILGAESMELACGVQTVALQKR